MTGTVFVVEWLDDLTHGIVGVFSSRDEAHRARDKYRLDHCDQLLRCYRVTEYVVDGDA